MNIGEAARAAGLPTKTVRYYADIGLVTPRGRGPNGYRDYGEAEVARLRFVRRARAFGFSVEECRELLRLFADRARRSADVKRIALERVARLEAQLRELEALRDDLRRLADACRGDAKPDCPILGALAGEAAEPAGADREADARETNAPDADAPDADAPDADAPRADLPRDAA